MTDSAVSPETVSNQTKMAPVGVDGTSDRTLSDKNVIQKNEMLPGPDEDLSTYLTFPPCSHLKKVLASPASKVVLKTYSTAIKICIMEPPEPPALKKHCTNHKEDNNLPNESGFSTNYYYHKNGKPASQRAIYKIRAKILRCKDCHTNSSLYMCLQCPNVGCLESGHAYDHASSSGHLFGKYLLLEKCVT